MIGVGDKVSWSHHDTVYSGVVVKVGLFAGQPAVWVNLGQMTDMDGKPQGDMVEIVDLADLAKRPNRQWLQAA